MINNNSCTSDNFNSCDIFKYDINIVDLIMTAFYNNPKFDLYMYVRFSHYLFLLFFSKIRQSSIS